MSNYITGHAVGIYTTDNKPVKDKKEKEIKYDSVTFYGGSGGVILDKIYGTNEKITPEMIKEYSYASKELYWKVGTYLMCWFENTLSGGNLPNVEEGITDWIIYRVDVDTKETIRIATLPSDKKEYHDYTALKDRKYEYWLIGINNNEASAPLISNRVECKYVGWFVIDPENETVFAFNLNDDNGGISVNETIHEYTTDGKYNVFSRGSTNFVSGNISAILYEYLDNFKQSTEFLDKFREFIRSERKKYVKDKKGRIYNSFLSGYSETPFSNDPRNPMTISFSFKECGEI